MSGLHVVFRVGSGEYGVAASDVLQMESYSGATPIPNAAEHVAGIMQIRGRVVPIVDLRVRFGMPQSDATIDSRVVVVQSGERTVGFLVDSAREVVQLAPEQIKAPPPLLASQSGGMIRAIASAGSRMVMLIDVARLLTENEEQVHGE